MRGEDDVPAHLLERLVERHALAATCSRDALERGQRGMALVQVHDVRPDVERLEHARAADAEQAVLREPDVRVAVVDARRRPAAHRVVLGQLGVEQEQRHAADLHAPDLERRSRGRRSSPRAAAARRPSPLTSAIGSSAGSWSSQYSCCVPVRSRRCDEVAAAVEEPDADHRRPRSLASLSTSPASTPRPPE